jgi:hypothetical protein
MPPVAPCANATLLHDQMMAAIMDVIPIAAHLTTIRS